MQRIYCSNKKICAGVSIPSKMSLCWDFEEFRDPKHAVSRTHRTEGFRPISPEASSGGQRPASGQPPRPSFRRQNDNLIPALGKDRGRGVHPVCGLHAVPRRPGLDCAPDGGI